MKRTGFDDDDRDVHEVGATRLLLGPPNAERDEP